MYSPGVPGVMVVKYRSIVLEYLEYWWYTTGVQYWSTRSTGGRVHVYITEVP